ncbi:MAG TPA: class I SAM-dependent methyltransferase [Clostridia bacterium]|nr:class I SAM-dependent methyltransferase [Clostridia bacterium]
MFETLEACAAAWEQAGNHGDIQTRIERNARWIPYYAFLADGRDEAQASIDPHAAAVADGLVSRGYLSAGSSVLDIGSGTGAFAHAFASRGASVTALEMDSTSLAVCRTQARQLGLQNMWFEQQMWETFAPEEQYDFVFSSMCPAICNYAELLRMESLAKHACGIIAVTRGSYDLHRKRLMALLDVHPTGGMTTEALWYFEALYLAGKQPEVQSFSRKFTYALPLEETIARNERYFTIFGITPEESRPKLTAYFASVAEGGMVADETLLNTQWITWRV